MKQFAALLIMAFSMNVLAFEVQEETTHALEQVSAYSQSVSQTTESALVSHHSEQAPKSTHSAPNENHCSHTGNCSFVLYTAESFVRPHFLKAAPDLIEAALISVFLENPSRPPLA